MRKFGGNHQQHTDHCQSIDSMMCFLHKGRREKTEDAIHTLVAICVLELEPEDVRPTSCLDIFNNSSLVSAPIFFIFGDPTPNPSLNDDVALSLSA
jgi:hypothetical protein